MKRTENGVKLNEVELDTVYEAIKNTTVVRRLPSGKIVNVYSFHTFADYDWYDIEFESLPCGCCPCCGCSCDDVYEGDDYL